MCTQLLTATQGDQCHCNAGEASCVAGYTFRPSQRHSRCRERMANVGPVEVLNLERNCNLRRVYIMQEWVHKPVPLHITLGRQLRCMLRAATREESLERWNCSTTSTSRVRAFNNVYPCRLACVIISCCGMRCARIPGACRLCCRFDLRRRLCGGDITGSYARARQYCSSSLDSACIFAINKVRLRCTHYVRAASWHMHHFRNINERATLRHLVHNPS